MPVAMKITMADGIIVPEHPRQVVFTGVVSFMAAALASAVAHYKKICCFCWLFNFGRFFF
jgi:hypothetical protein